MEMIKSILVDSLNGFSPKYIPLFLFQMLTAGLIGYVFQRLVNRKFDEKIIQNGTLLTLGIAFVVAIAKNSLSFSVLAAAAILLIGMMGQKDRNQTLGYFLLAIIGVGCGVGSVIQTIIGAVLLAVVLLFLPMKNEVK